MDDKLKNTENKSLKDDALEQVVGGLLIDPIRPNSMPLVPPMTQANGVKSGDAEDEHPAIGIRVRG